MTEFPDLEEFLSAGADRMDLTGACLAVCAGADPAADAAASRAELLRMADELRTALRPADSPRKTMRRIATFLFGPCAFRAVPAQVGRDTFLPTTVLRERAGSCLGLSLAYLMLGERLSLPLAGVLVREHCFVRFDDGRDRVNAETAREGMETFDHHLMDASDPACRPDGPYLRSLGKGEVLAVLLSTRAGHLDIPHGRQADAERGLDLALRLFPDLPDALLNRAILTALRGRHEDALAGFARALEVDPRLAGALRGRAAVLRALGRHAAADEDDRRLAELGKPPSPRP